MGTSPAFSFYAKDFATGTATMSLAEVGAYVRLLIHQWEAGSVPSSPRERARLLGCTAAQEKAVWAVVAAKFVAVGNAYKNTRLESERMKQLERRQKLSENGSKGGRPPLKQTETNSLSPAKPEAKANGNQNKSLASSSSFALKTTPRPLTAKRNLNAEFEHERFDVPTSWHVRTVGGLRDGEARLMQFYRWLSDRVERTNEDTLPRFEWLDRCFREWLEASTPQRSSVPSPAETAKMIADRVAMADPESAHLTVAEKIARSRQ